MHLPHVDLLISLFMLQVLEQDASLRQQVHQERPKTHLQRAHRLRAATQLLEEIVDRVLDVEETPDVLLDVELRIRANDQSNLRRSLEDHQTLPEVSPRGIVDSELLISQ